MNFSLFYCSLVVIFNQITFFRATKSLKLRKNVRYCNKEKISWIRTDRKKNFQLNYLHQHLHCEMEWFFLCFTFCARVSHFTYGNWTRRWMSDRFGTVQSIWAVVESIEYSLLPRWYFPIFIFQRYIYVLFSYTYTTCLYSY